MRESETSPIDLTKEADLCEKNPETSGEDGLFKETVQMDFQTNESEAERCGFLLEPPNWERASNLTPSPKPLLDSFTYRVELDRMLAELESLNSAKPVQPKLMYVIEFCCGPDSEIGKQGPSHHAEVLRITEEPGKNIMSSVGLARAFEFAQKHPGAHLWGSLPCTAWSSIQALNIHMYGAPFLTKLHRQQRESLRMLKHFIALAKGDQGQRRNSDIRVAKGCWGMEGKGCGEDD